MQTPKSSCATDLNNPTIVNQNCKRTVPVRADLINSFFIDLLLFHSTKFETKSWLGSNFSREPLSTFFPFDILLLTFEKLGCKLLFVIESDSIYVYPRYPGRVLTKHSQPSLRIHNSALHYIEYQVKDQTTQSPSSMRGFGSFALRRHLKAP